MKSAFPGTKQKLIVRDGVLVVRSPADGDLRDSVRRSREERAKRLACPAEQEPPSADRPH